jgi:hypothetical protein
MFCPGSTKMSRALTFRIDSSRGPKPVVISRVAIEVPNDRFLHGCCRPTYTIDGREITTKAFASEQLHSLSATLTQVTQNLRRLAAELSKSQARFTEQGIRNKISRWLSDSFVREVLHYELEHRENRWHLNFQVDHPALQ